MTRAKLATACVATVLTLVALEAVLRVYHVWRLRAMSRPAEDPNEIPVEVRCSGAHLYRLNPDHPEISAQGLRDREFALPRPEGGFRVLVLGDSVTFGAHVLPARTFAKRLEAMLGQHCAAVEVINAGVSGYTAYNELHFYLEELRALAPDLVLVAACLNDVVNPRLHWHYAGGFLDNIPDEAIPDPVYDRDQVLPRIEEMRYPARAFGSEVLGLLLRRVRSLWRRFEPPVSPPAEPWPTRLTVEDPISIHVLLDRDSPEWRWLGSIYDRLFAAVREDGATPVVVVLPLAYQLDPAYPFLPQTVIEDYCASRSVAWLDLLPIMRDHRHERLFVGPTPTYDDIWHLTERGHEVVAEAIGDFLVERGLITPCPQPTVGE